MQNYFYSYKFIKEIKKIYYIFGKVNINEIEQKFTGKNNYDNKTINSTINIGFTLDNNYILETMLIVTSIMATQNKTTKIRFHLGVTPISLMKI